MTEDCRLLTRAELEAELTAANTALRAAMNWIDRLEDENKMLLSSIKGR